MTLSQLDTHEGAAQSALTMVSTQSAMRSRLGRRAYVVAHGDAVVDGDRVEFLAAPPAANGSGDEVSPDVLQVHVVRRTG